MNFGNALGFLGLGVSMWLLPWVAPAWFPHTAIDGSSTRALWTQLMGMVQCGIGVCAVAHLLAQTVLAQAERAAIPRGALATADWEGDIAATAVLAVDRASAGNSASALAASPVLREANAGRMAQLGARVRDSLLGRPSGTTLLHLMHPDVVDYTLYLAQTQDHDGLERLRALLEQISREVQRGKPAPLAQRAAA